MHVLKKLNFEHLGQDFLYDMTVENFSIEPVRTVDKIVDSTGLAEVYYTQLHALRRKALPAFLNGSAERYTQDFSKVHVSKNVVGLFILPYLQASM